MERAVRVLREAQAEAAAGCRGADFAWCGRGRGGERGEGARSGHRCPFGAGLKHRWVPLA